MKDKIETLISELNNKIQKEQEFRKQTEPKPNNCDAIRSIDREYTTKRIVAQLEKIILN